MGNSSQTDEGHQISSLHARWEGYQERSRQTIEALKAELRDKDYIEISQADRTAIQYQVAFDLIIEISLVILWGLLNRNRTLGGTLADLQHNLLKEVQLRVKESHFLEELCNSFIKSQSNTINFPETLSDRLEEAPVFHEDWKLPSSARLDTEMIANFIKKWDASLTRIKEVETAMFPNAEPVLQGKLPRTPPSKEKNFLEGEGQSPVVSPARPRRTRSGQGSPLQLRRAGLLQKHDDDESALLKEAEDKLLEIKARSEKLECEKESLEKENQSLCLSMDQLEKKLSETEGYISWAEKEWEEFQKEKPGLEAEIKRLQGVEKQLSETEEYISWVGKEWEEFQKEKIRLKAEIERLWGIEKKLSETEEHAVRVEQKLQESHKKEARLKNKLENLQTALTWENQQLALKNIFLRKEVNSLKNDAMSWQEERADQEKTNYALHKKIAGLVRTLQTDTEETVEDMEVVDFAKELKHIKVERDQAQRLWYIASERLSQAEDTIQVFNRVMENLSNIVSEEQCKLDNAHPVDEATSCTVKNSISASQDWAEVVFRLQSCMQEVDELLDTKESISMMNGGSMSLPRQHRDLVVSLQALQSQFIDIAEQCRYLLRSKTISEEVTSSSTGLTISHEAGCDNEATYQTTGFKNHEALIDIDRYFKEFEVTLALRLDSLYRYLDALRDNLSTQSFKWAHQMSTIMQVKLDYLVLSQEVKRGLASHADSMNQFEVEAVYQLERRAEFILKHLPQLMSLKFAKAALDKLKIDFEACAVMEQFEGNAAILSCKQKIALLEKRIAVPMHHESFKAVPYIVRPWVIQPDNCEKVAYEAFDVFEQKQREFSWNQVTLVVSSIAKSKEMQGAKLELYQQPIKNSEESVVDLKKVIISLIQLIAPYAEQDNGVVVTIEGNQEHVQTLFEYLYANKALWQEVYGSAFNIVVKTPQYKNIQPPSEEMLQEMDAAIFGEHTFFTKSRMRPMHFNSAMAAPLISAQ